jgi:hypothetical protein
MNLDSLDSSIDTMMGYGLDSWGLIFGRGNIFLFFTAFRLASGPTKPPIHLVLRTFSPGVKKPKHEADHSPTYNADTKNGEAVLPLLSCLHGTVLN